MMEIEAQPVVRFTDAEAGLLTACDHLYAAALLINEHAERAEVPSLANQDGVFGGVSDAALKVLTAVVAPPGSIPALQELVWFHHGEVFASMSAYEFSGDNPCTTKAAVTDLIHDLVSERVQALPLPEGS